MSQDHQMNRPFSRRTFLGTTAAVSMSALSASRVLGANDRLGFGVIGVGGRGFGAHAAAIDALKTQGMAVDVVAVCDTFRPRMQKAAERYEAKGYMNHHELLADANVDVVTIATPDHIHGYQALDAIKAGKDVYCEKPVTHWRQFELTKRMSQEVKKSSQVFQLGTQGMSDGAWHLMKKLVQDGQIGQPIHAECGYFRVGDWGERGMPIDDPNATPGADLDWEAFLGDSPKRPFDVSRYFRWRMYEDYAGGPVTDLFPHSYTPVLSILGVSFPSKVVATGGMFRYTEREVPDTFNMLVDYPEKITVACLGTQGNNFAGTGGRGAGSRLPIIRGWEGTLTVEDTEIAFTPAEGSQKEAKRFPIEHGEDWYGYWKHFIECIKKRDKNTLSTMEMGYHVQTAMQMGMLGYRKEKVALFDPQKEEITFG